MFTPHQSTHQFSPQRRQILGTNKRLSPKKAHLGNQEASNIGPQKLFSDLKQTSAKKPSTSASVFGKPSRALGEKTNQSPERARQQRDAGDVPVKPQGKSVSSSGSKLKAKDGQLVSPSKIDTKSDSIFLASSSPSKRKKKQITTQPQASLSKHEVDNSPIKSSAMGKALPSSEFDREGSHVLSSKQKTPEPRSVPSKIQQPAFMTPAANIGQAGAVRQRMGEMMDAMVDGHASVAHGDASMMQSSEGLTEEELYPEIEYMPPRVEVPYDFPPMLDGMPRGKEMGEMLHDLPLMGFYKATRPASIEVQRQEALADIPDRIAVESLDDVRELPAGDDLDQNLWPDVEVEEPAPRRTLVKHIAGSTTGQPQSTASRKATPVTQHRSAAPSALRTDNTIKRTQQRSTANVAQHATRSTVPQRLAHSSKPSSKPVGKPAQTTLSNKPRPLADKNTNAPIRRKVLNPALVDFENDKMGKVVQAKLQACEDERGFEGFAL